MPRLKTLLSCVGLSSLGARLLRGSRAADETPIEPRNDEFKINPADRWRAWKAPLDAKPSEAVERLSSTLSSLRQTLSQIAGEAPLSTGPDATADATAMFFDGDLFDGEPAPVEAATGSIIGLDEDLFDDVAPAPRRAPASPQTDTANQVSA